MPAPIAPETSSSAVTTEAGNRLNSATADDMTRLALSVQTSSMQISPELQDTMSTSVKVDIGLGRPVIAGLNARIELVPTTTAS